MNILQKQNKVIDIFGRFLTTGLVLLIIYFVFVNFDLEKYFRYDFLFGFCYADNPIGYVCRMLSVAFYGRPILFFITLALFIFLLIKIIVHIIGKAKAE